MNKISESITSIAVVAISKEHYEILNRIAEENDVSVRDVVTDVIDRGLKSSKYRQYATKSSSEKSRRI